MAKRELYARYEMLVSLLCLQVKTFRWARLATRTCPERSRLAVQWRGWMFWGRFMNNVPLFQKWWVGWFVRGQVCDGCGISGGQAVR